MGVREEGKVESSLARETKGWEGGGGAERRSRRVMRKAEQEKIERVRGYS